MEKITTTFDPSKFPYSTKNDELKKEIDSIIENQKIPLEKRINTPAAKALYEQGLKLHEKLIATMGSKNWAPKDNEPNLTSATMKGEDGFLCVKCTSTVRGSPIEVLAYTGLDKYKEDYDKSFLSGKDIEVFGSDMRILNWIFKGKLMVSNRDFVMLSHRIFKPDGSIYVAFGSIEDSRAPAAKDPVRAKNIISGFEMKPKGTTRCEITYITQIDLAGSIPQMLQNQIAKGQAEKTKLISESFDKRFGKK